MSERSRELIIIYFSFLVTRLEKNVEKSINMLESTFVVKPTNQILKIFFVYKSDIHLPVITEKCSA